MEYAVQIAGRAYDERCAFANLARENASLDASLSSTRIHRHADQEIHNGSCQSLPNTHAVALSGRIHRVR
jgi:hypothetical protein